MSVTSVIIPIASPEDISSLNNNAIENFTQLSPVFNVAFVDISSNSNSKTIYQSADYTLVYPDDLSTYYNSIDLAYLAVKDLPSPVVCLVGESNNDAAIASLEDYSDVVFISGIPIWKK